MKNRYSFWLILLLFLGNMKLLKAQNFLAPKLIKNFLQTRALVSSRSDLKYIESNIEKFKHLEILKIQGPVDIAEVSKVASKLDGLDEIQLFEFQGILSDADIQSLEWIPSVYLYVPANREEAFLLNSAWKYLQKVTLKFEIIPESWEFLSYWKSLKTLSILGDFDEESASACVSALAISNTRLSSLGLSLSSFKEIPAEVHKLKKLKTFTLIDYGALERLQSLEELGEEVKSFPGLKFKFISDVPTLTASDEEIILKKFKVTLKDNKISESTDDTEETYDFVSLFDIGLTLSNMTSQELLRTSAFNQDFLLNDYSQGRYVFIGSTEFNQKFLADQRLAVIIPANSLVYSNSNEVKTEFNGKYGLKITFAQTEDERACNKLFSSGSNSSPIYNTQGIVKIDISDLNSGKSLNVKDGYFIQIRFIGEKSDQSQFWAWNKSKSKWENQYDYDYEFSDDQLQKIDFYQMSQTNQMGEIQSIKENLNLEDCFEHGNYNYLMPPTSTSAYFSPYQKYWVQTNDRLTPGSKEFRKIVRGKPLIQIRSIPAGNKSYVYLQIIDRTQVLFPELKPFENFNFAIKTENSIGKVKEFFKNHRIVDIQFYKSNGVLIMNIKTTDGFWGLELVEPKNLPFLSASEKLVQQKKFEAAVLKYETIYKQKAAVLKSLNASKEIQKQQISTSVLLGSTATLKSGKKRYEFSVRSTGTFMIAKQDSSVSEALLELVFCENGKIPIAVKEVLISLKSPNASIYFGKQERYRLPLNASQIEMILVKDQKNKVYGIGGDELMKLQLPQYTLTYIDLRLISPEINTPELLYKTLAQKFKKTK